VIDVHIPKMGMSTVEVDVVGILVRTGDRVGVGDPLVEVDGEKATFAIESEVEGVVAEVLVAEGDEAKVGDVVVRIDTDGAA
jgi:pyruvate/2-oxoglutarate dehydrogenase complex dihydrolipoamide acyltransferase (E2) component